MATVPTRWATTAEGAPRDRPYGEGGRRRHNHSCALLDDASVKCWGSNTNGQLGLGDTGDRGDVSGEMGDALPATQLARGTPQVVAATAELRLCAARRRHRQVLGLNGNGQLGLGDQSNRGNNPNEMATPYRRCSLP